MRCKRTGPGFRAALILAVLLAGFVLLQACLPLSTAVKIGADEGFELAKTTLVLHGHRLYTEIWNDQPPLQTVLLTWILRHVSPSVLGLRLVTVGFAALLLGAVFALVLRCGAGILPVTHFFDVVRTAALASQGFRGSAHAPLVFCGQITTHWS